MLSDASSGEVGVMENMVMSETLTPVQKLAFDWLWVCPRCESVQMTEAMMRARERESPSE